MAKRRSAAKWIAASVVGLTAVGVATYVVLRVRRRADACPPGRHVGAPGYTWPRPDLFLDQSGFGEALETLGYDVGDWSAPTWHPCSSQVQQAIEEFQKDYNLVWKTVKEPVTPELPVTGLINDDTALAIAYADGVQAAGFSWPVVVEETRRGGA